MMYNGLELDEYHLDFVLDYERELGTFLMEKYNLIEDVYLDEYLSLIYRYILPRELLYDKEIYSLIASKLLLTAMKMDDDDMRNFFRYTLKLLDNYKDEAIKDERYENAYNFNELMDIISI